MYKIVNHTAVEDSDDEDTSSEGFFILKFFKLT